MFNQNEVERFTNGLCGREENGTKITEVAPNAKYVVINNGNNDDRGVFTDKGKVSSGADLPLRACDFDLYHIDDENVDVYARNIDGALTWVRLSGVGGSADLSGYETKTGASEKMNAAVESAKAYTDSQMAGKLGKNEQASDSALLNGKADKAFATAAQGIKADNALPVSGGSLTGAVTAGGAQAIASAQIRNITASTTDLTAGSSALATGNIYLVYE